jgi:hypothetical protein
MHLRNGLLVLLSVLIIAATVYGGWANFQPQPQLPFAIRWMDAHHAILEPIPGLTPTSLHAGDRLDLAQQSYATLIALLGSESAFLPPLASYPLVVERGLARINVTVHPVDGKGGAILRWAEWAALYAVILYAFIALLALWWGHDRAAFGMAFWAMAEAPLAFAVTFLWPSTTPMVLFALLGAVAFSLMGRIGFYVMVESIVGSAIPPGRRARWRGLFALVLGAATVVTFGGPVAVVALGWGGLMQSWLQWVLPASYLVPFVLLMVSFRHADAQEKLRLRWLIWGSVLFLTGLVFTDIPLPLNYVVSILLADGLTTLSCLAFLYAVLRHRVVNITVAINRALVYALTTSLVLGLFALLESLVERSALSRGTGLLLELAVPLGLGAALSTVHGRIEAMVERYIFRRQYRAETALRRFAEECGFITEPENLFKIGIAEIVRHMNAPRVALYERIAGGYTCRWQQGKPALPEQIPADDPVFIGLRARHAEPDQRRTGSVLGTDVYAYPLRQRGDLLGALVVSERPGEHYAADERSLLFHVAHEMGAALFALRVQEHEARAQENEEKARQSEMRAQANELLLKEARMREVALLNALHITGSAGDA